MHTSTRRTFLKNFGLTAFGIPWILSCSSHLHSSKHFRLGYFAGSGFPDLEFAFLDELSKLGLKEGRNLVIEKELMVNAADGNMMAKKLAVKDISLVVVTSIGLGIAIRNVNPNMPIVFSTCPGMVSNGFAQTLEHPGGLYTGLDELPPGVTAKRLRLLKTAVPSVNRVALLSTTPGKGGHEIQLADAEKTAAELAIEVKPYRATTLPELEKALADLQKEGMNGMLSFQGGLSVVNRKLIVDFANENRIPALYQATMFTQAGGLMAWAPDLIKQQREAAHYVEKILKGAKPGDLPVKHPEKYFLTVNQAAAKKIGIAFPPEILAQADSILVS